MYNVVSFFSTFRYLAASQLQSIDARKVFPCFDEPDLKANFSVSIEHKEGKNLNPAWYILSLK